jgi:hypothetical protein
MFSVRRSEWASQASVWLQNHMPGMRPTGGRIPLNAAGRFRGRGAIAISTSRPD